MRELLEYLIKGITGKEDFSIEEASEDDKVTYNVRLAPDEIGLVIGREGKVIKAIQTLMRVRGGKENLSIIVNVSEKEA
ncbi:hypothetical protein A2686_02505 [Candidatus Woesebacteria bacterium RIFCSPHIGHO2_01_FULL_38_10]|uniref:Uncharacterized protein n=1 Tax=Candidatus Woesebacteria bacterium RIFCSPLOWO2_01_FULL_39_10b TaxID=1802517 RepID=A0A1F8B9T8_9BACT|nr:MAG: hypothetical protein A2686_02505 [Candidatus Woesebacteria bacterium RIFCSPHIGHO2_01_FULL_38_10]OGM60439.1 MAG: hypothetical protein A2892_00195 [Candidatus Woesebacteria bacterium RIFCSPLOWO2_01_FULL_39_10b]